jgi:hypothetical protein
LSVGTGQNAPFGTLADAARKKEASNLRLNCPCGECE